MIVYLIFIVILVTLGYFGWKTDHKSFVGTLFGAIFALFIVVFFERELRPQISIREEKTPFVRPEDGSKFLRVIVENPALSWPLNRIMDRRPAYQARASITFLTESNNPVFAKGRQMIGRWSKTEQPVRPILISQSPSGSPQITSLWDLSVTRDAVDIGSGASEPLDIVMRTPSEDGCRGWHNRWIGNPNPRPEDQFELPKGRYRALVRVETAGRTFKALFRIVCDVGIRDFRLEPINPLPSGLDP